MVDWLSEFRGLPVRAPRFPLQMRLRYRKVDESPWREGETHNISRSGVLFSVEELIAPATQVEMLLALPAQLSRQPGARIHCRGEVVRQVPSAAGSVPALAARIRAYRFLTRHGDYDLNLVPPGPGIFETPY